MQHSDMVHAHDACVGLGGGTIDCGVLDRGMRDRSSLERGMLAGSHDFRHDFPHMQ